YDFLTKPFQRAQLLRLIRQALERRDLIQQNRALQQRLDDLLQQGAVIGSSPAFRRMMTLLEQVAGSSATVLVQGESGTGKELVARTIHARSARSRGPFVAVNCAALPETLLESELFGYEKGAFTGAAGRKEGRFELADGGTLFLDEVSDLSAVTQPKILRVLQDDEIRRLEAYAWPGNVRELENVIERGVVLTQGALMDMTDLPPEIAGATPLPEGVLSIRIGTPLAEVEARLLEETLRATKGNKTLTAKLLGIDPTTVLRKLKRQDEQGEGDAAS